MAGNDHANAIATVRGADGAAGAGATQGRGDLRVGTRLAVRNGKQLFPDRALPVAARPGERHFEVLTRAGEVLSQLGFRLLQRLGADVAELGFVETSAKQDGRNMTMVLAPHKGAKTRVKAQESAAAPPAQRAPAPAPEQPADAAPAAEAPAAAAPATPAQTN